MKCVFGSGALVSTNVVYLSERAITCETPPFFLNGTGLATKSFNVSVTLNGEDVLDDTFVFTYFG
jgi:hypothetical protein